ncbi:extended synaptotagmin-2-like isoform X2 [Brienomyrus brachyistius]|uniref:extended synaptotagmin-2-like isoform X2 n=1 Tax=Brienomyrus brachyistius TaxID=42636 RepID=UPI0020B37FE8|nr:extended synaptotagmin-2-like isoform X2 [Brienomyrus brachyistius]
MTGGVDDKVHGAAPGSTNPKEKESKVAPSPEPPSVIDDVGKTWMQFAKSFVLILPVYVMGFLGFSFSWILIGVLALLWWRRNKGEKSTRFHRALAFLDEEVEEVAVKSSLSATELPSWVQFPDVERVEWLNKTVKQMWPYICQFVDKLFRDTIEPAVKEANAHLSTFCFTKIDLGDKPLRINGVKVYTENVDKRQVIMDLQISFAGKTEINVDIKRYYCRAGIKSIQLSGIMRVVMEPLLGDIPLVGALSLFFLNKPLLDINWTGLTNMLDIPGINGLCDGLIQDIIYSNLVLPNRITIPLVGKDELQRLRFPMPKGVLRIHFVEAQDLEGKDTYLGGLIKGKSDPYGVIRIGNQVFQSKTIKENLNPKWNEIFEILVYDQSGQNIDIELYDEDPDKDDFLGSLMIDIDEVQKEQKVDEWFTLEEVITGKLHLKLEWLSLLSSPEKLDQVLTSVKADRIQSTEGLSSCLLVTYLDSARKLPLGKKAHSEPSPYVQFYVGKKKQESKIRYKTSEPVWEESFSFLIHNPLIQELKVEVKDDKHKSSLGTLTMPLTELLQAEDMLLDQSFPLKNSGPNSTLKLKIALKVLALEKDSLPDHPSSVQVKKASAGAPASPTHKGVPNATIPGPAPKGVSNAVPQGPASKGIPNVASPGPAPESVSSIAPPGPAPKSMSSAASPGPAPMSTSELPVPLPVLAPAPHMELPRHGSFSRMSRGGLSTSNLTLSRHYKGSSASIASDISLPVAAQELKRRLYQLQNGGVDLGDTPLGQVQMTLRHSAQRNQLIVVLHCCRNLIPFNKDGSDPYVRLYLLPNKSRSGRRKTRTMKKTQNPVYDQTFEFSVPQTELYKRILDVTVKNGGGILPKHKGLLGKVLVELTSKDILVGYTQWFDLSEDGYGTTGLA